MVAVAGATAIESSVAFSTSRLAEPVNVFAPLTTVATAVVNPAPVPCAKPVLAMLATALSTVLHVTAFEEYRLRVLPSWNVPIAANCTCVPTAIMELPGVTETPVRFDKSTIIDATLLVTLSNFA